MFDLKTLVVVLFFNTLMQSVVWAAIWLSSRRFSALKIVAGGLALMALGLLLFMQRHGEPYLWRIILDNLLIKTGLLMLADGWACFLGQPRYTWLVRSWLALHALTWSAATIWFPGALEYRLLSAATYTTGIMFFMCLTLHRDRTQPRGLRQVTIAILTGHALAVWGEFGATAFLRSEGDAAVEVLSNVDSWYLLEANLFLMACFGYMSFILTNRLTSDLKFQNEALALEVRRRRQLEAKLSASLNAEKALREDQEQFIRMVGHEFRTPLAIIRRATEMTGLMLDKPPAGVAARLGSIDEAVSRLISLIDRFLVIDRREGGVLQLDDIDINAMIDDVDRHFEALGMAGRLRIESYPGTLIYRGDPDMLLTVMINLVDNALKYSPSKTIVEIAAGARDGAVVMTVADEGIGIPSEEQSRIGSRFFRASNTRAATGTGLGLYNSRRLLAYHDGTLTLKPRRDGGGGTVATVRLPLPGPVASDDESRKVVSV